MGVYATFFGLISNAMLSEHSWVRTRRWRCNTENALGAVLSVPYSPPRSRHNALIFFYTPAPGVLRDITVRRVVAEAGPPSSCPRPDSSQFPCLLERAFDAKGVNTPKACRLHAAWC